MGEMGAGQEQTMVPRTLIRLRDGRGITIPRERRKRKKTQGKGKGGVDQVTKTGSFINRHGVSFARQVKNYGNGCSTCTGRVYVR